MTAFLRSARRAGALLTVALTLACAAPSARAAGWALDLAPDIRALTQAGGYLFALSYTTGQKPSVVIYCVDIDTGILQWKNVLDHMRGDVVHLEAVGDGDSVYIAVPDATNPRSGYLLCSAAKPSVFELKRARPGFAPGVAVINHVLFSTSGAMGQPVQWHALDPIHNKFTTALGVGGPSGCVGRPVGYGRQILLPEAGALVVATAAGKTQARIPVGACSWGAPQPMGSVVGVMTSGASSAMTVAGVSPASRKVLWRVPAPPNPDKVKYTPTLTASGTRALATYATVAQVIDATGKVTAKIPMRGVRQVIPASNGRVVVALGNRHVLLVNLATGTTKDLGTAVDEVGAMHIMRGHLFVAAGTNLRDWGSL